MKSIVVAVLLFAIVELSLADDDGQYHPEKYENDGKYRPGQDGRYYDKYKNYYGTDNQYYRYNPYSNQQYYRNLSPFQQLLAPYNTLKNRVEQETAQVSVTSRPPAVVSTVRPIVYAAPTTAPLYRDTYKNEQYARIVNQESDSNENSYNYKYLTENGISAGESGVVDAVSGGTRVSGFYEYVGDDGRTYRVDYTADENGFHPTGAHLP